MTFTLFIEQLANGIGYGLMLFLIAAGMTLIFGVMDTMNIAHGTLYMLGAYFGATAQLLTGSFLLALLAAVGGALVSGAVLELLLMRRLYLRNHLVQVVATFGVILVAEDAVKALWGVAPLMAATPQSLAGSVQMLPDLPYPAYRLLVLFVGLAVALGLYVVVGHTRIGMLVRAGASNRRMAELMGVRVRRVFAAIFGLGAVLAGLAGALMGPITAVQIGMGEAILIPALVVIVIGGLGSIRGAFVAALLVGVIDTAGRAFAPPLLRQLLPPALASDLASSIAGLAMYLLMIVVLVVKPQGLFPARG
ncbi:branched-chain amino acid ABC transporter permease [Variovorax sp. J31P207]|uniref:branched-chain amino acid ABC transporter permease n=1 Tax=Variovorax sp. J31P207 TaxID=3053510 RepID=UPI0025791A4E|nr:branched-chain amino acid ABC transporter permease [Variovorax sp. J31P207]MDM0068242.1 branched-chain amino acid ABC transporter permease [Variovorax sp. J31P207]